MTDDQDTSTYTLMFCGNCLGDVVQNGTLLTIDLTRRPDVLDVVAVGLAPKPDSPYMIFANGIGAEDFIGVCKVYLGSKIGPTGEVIHLVGQLSPPGVSPIPESEIVAIHPVVAGTIPAITDGKLSTADLAALALLLPFAAVDMTLQPERAAA